MIISSLNCVAEKRRNLIYILNICQLHQAYAFLASKATMSLYDHDYLKLGFCEQWSEVAPLPQCCLQSPHSFALEEAKYAAVTAESLSSILHCKWQGNWTSEEKCVII